MSGLGLLGMRTGYDGCFAADGCWVRVGYVDGCHGCFPGGLVGAGAGCCFAFSVTY